MNTLYSATSTITSFIINATTIMLNSRPYSLHHCSSHIITSMSLIRTLLLAAGNGSSFQSFNMPVLGEMMNFVTPLPPETPTSAPVIPTPPFTTDAVDYYRHLNPVKSLPKYLKTVFPSTVTVVAQYQPESVSKPSPSTQGDNITVFSLNDVDAKFKTIHPEPPLVGTHDNWDLQHRKQEHSKLPDSYRKPLPPPTYQQTRGDQHINYITPDMKLHEFFHRPPPPTPRPLQQSAETGPVKSVYEPVRKVPISRIENLNFFLPSLERRPLSEFTKSHSEMKSNTMSDMHVPNLFEPVIQNNTGDFHIPHVILPQSSGRDQAFRKHVTILKTKDMKSPKPTEMYHDVLWEDDSKAHHVLTKDPNPYETVLLRPVLNSKPDVASTYTQNSKATHMGTKTYTTLDLEHLLNQMDVETVANKNLGRSADKDPGDPAGLLPRLGVCVLLNILTTDSQF